MKLILRKSIYSLSIFYSFNCFASYSVRFISNYDENVLVLQKINVLDKSKNLITMLYRGDSHSYSEYDYLLLQFKDKISFVDTNTPCSWVQIFSSRYAHGWGLKMYINDTEMGTICANRKFIIDTKINAKVEFYKGDDNKLYAKFYNDGWWQNSDVFPNSIDFKIE